MKILMTGSRGLLGTDLHHILKERYPIIAGERNMFDIVDYQATRNLIKESKPDAIIHLAAYSDVDGCERDREAAFRVNALGTRNIAAAAEEIGARVLYISTDYIFDGKKEGPYFEYDQANPLNIYGRSKLEGENFIRSLCTKYYIVRTSWLFGQNGKSFIRAILQQARTKDTITIVKDQIGCPTYTVDLSHAVAQLIESDAYGTYHITNSHPVSWYDFAGQIFEKLGMADIKLMPITAKELSRPAARPQNSVLDNFYWKLNGFRPLRSYEEALTDMLKSLQL